MTMVDYIIAAIDVGELLKNWTLFKPSLAFHRCIYCTS